ncbi:putative peptidyl-tRNA hydrolase PTRHD1 [Agelaius phoeniceus]|uniref:putative peptidyl-tRNA hydrolase PTRHD1 n=1 Tax=Agelaius phoeniceus TaxID=39638 RepID=UPI00405510C1
MAAALVQYVVLRGDLARPPHSWPLGAVVAQGCHAALAAVHGYREFHFSFSLQAPDENSLLGLAQLLREKGLEHKMWVEKPEGIPTGLALRPYPKGLVQPHLSHFKLLK